MRVRPLNAEELAEGYGIDVTSAATVQARGAGGIVEAYDSNRPCPRLPDSDSPPLARAAAPASPLQIALPAGEGKAAPLDMGGIGQKGAKRAREFSFDLCLGPNSTQVGRLVSTASQGAVAKLLAATCTHQSTSTSLLQRSQQNLAD